MKYLILLFWLVVCVNIANALSDLEKLDLSFRNRGQSLLECSSFYHSVNECLNNSKEQQSLAKSYMELSNSSLELGLLILSETKMNREAQKSFLIMSKKNMAKITENRCENISILLNKYSDLCENLMKNPSKDLEKRTISEK